MRHADRHACCAQEELFIKFAEFEERCKEHERARAIYKYALDHIPKAQADGVYQRFVVFEKQHGDREGIEVGTPRRVEGYGLSVCRVVGLWVSTWPSTHQNNAAAQSFHHTDRYPGPRTRYVVGRWCAEWEGADMCRRQPCAGWVHVLTAGKGLQVFVVVLPLSDSVRLIWRAQDVIVGERRFQYEADVKRDPLNYDSWFDYIRLEESAGQPDRVGHQTLNPTPRSMKEKASWHRLWWAASW